MGDFSDEEIEACREEELRKACEHNELALDALQERYCSELGYREVLHLSHVFATNVEDYLLSHPAIAYDQESYALAWRAWEALRGLYQSIGRLELETRERG